MRQSLVSLVSRALGSLLGQPETYAIFSRKPGRSHHGEYEDFVEDFAPTSPEAYVPRSRAGVVDTPAHLNFRSAFFRQMKLSAKGIRHAHTQVTLERANKK
jgi:hypothetical protein